MKLISQNLLKYGFSEDGVVIRINLAWVDNLDTLKSQLNSLDSPVFLDSPTGRTKPPNNSYSLEEIRELVLHYKNIKYLAISNIEHPSELEPYFEYFSRELILVPKIETKKGVENIAKIISVLKIKKILMLDHDDLFRDLQRLGIPPSSFFEVIDELVDFCELNSVNLLRMRGVIFSDEDNYYYK